MLVCNLFSFFVLDSWISFLISSYRSFIITLQITSYFYCVPKFSACWILGLSNPLTCDISRLKADLLSITLEGWLLDDSIFTLRMWYRLYFYWEIASAYFTRCGHPLLLPVFLIFDVLTGKLRRSNICWYIFISYLIYVSSTANCLFTHFAHFSLRVFIFSFIVIITIIIFKKLFGF